MITTSSFPNVVTSAPNNEMERNSLTKEDLEGKVKKGISTISNKNGGSCVNIKL